MGNGICFKKTIPVKAVKKCPKKTFLGWEKGLSGNPNNKTIEDPKEAIKKTPKVVS